MRRFALLFCLFVVCFGVAISVGQQSLRLGLISYQTGLSYETTNFSSYLMDRLNIEIDAFETEPPGDYGSCYDCMDQQVDMLVSMIEGGVRGIVLTPSPPVDDKLLLKPALKWALFFKEVPLVYAVKRVLGPYVPFYGPDYYHLGMSFAEAKDNTVPFAVIGYFNDPSQQEFMEGMRIDSDFRKSYRVFEGNGEKEALQAFEEIDQLKALIVTDPSLVEGVAAATSHIREENQIEIRIASLGPPRNWPEMFRQGLLHAFFTWDQFAIIEQATKELKLQLTNGIEAEGEYSDVFFFAPNAESKSLEIPYRHEVLRLFWGKD